MRVKEFLLDLDGMLYVGDESVEGAREDIAAGKLERLEWVDHPMSEAQEIVNYELNVDFRSPVRGGIWDRVASRRSTYSVES